MEIPLKMQTPILSVMCDEKNGDRLRNVYPLTFTLDTLRKFWEKSKKFPVLFTTEIQGDFNKFTELIVSPDGDGYIANGLFLQVDDLLGIFYMTEIKPEWDAICHFTFFDGRLRGRDILVKRVLQYVFNKYNFHRLSVEVPYFAPMATTKFVYHLGFKMEGKKRSCALYQGKWFDSRLFGLLKEEALLPEFLERRQRNGSSN